MYSFLFPGRRLLRSFLNKNMKIKLTDGRVLIGIFLCTDKDANVILGTCDEYLNEECLINSTQLDEGPRHSDPKTIIPLGNSVISEYFLIARNFSGSLECEKLNIFA